MGRVHPHARGADLPDRQSVLRLEVRVRAGALHGRPPDRTRPRQDPWRLQQHQRDDLPARQPAGLRAVGRRCRHGGLGLRALPAVLQADGDLPGRRGRLPRPRRSAGAGARTGYQPAVQRVPRRHHPGRSRPHRRRQRLPPGGVRPLRPQPAPRPAPQRGRRLPAPGPVPAEPSAADPRLCHPRAVRRHPGDRRRVSPRRRAAASGLRQRGHPVRRLDQLPAAAAAVRCRQRRRAAGPRRRRGRRRARRWREPAGPPRGLHPARVHAAGVDRARDGQVAGAADRRAVAVPAQRPRCDQPLRGRRLRPQQRHRRLPQPDVPLPAHRHPLRRHHAGRRPRLPGAPRSDVLRRPRLGEDHVAQREGQAGPAVQLPVDRAGPPRVGGGDPLRPRDPAAVRARSLQRRRNLARTRGRDRRADPGLGGQGRRDRAAPVVHRTDGHR